MRVVSVLARPLLAGIFVVAGAEAARSPGGRTAAAAKLGLPKPDLVVRANGATMVAAGLGLGLGVRPRLAALLCLATLAPTTYAGHAFWEHDDPQARSAQRVQFLKNLGLAGGLLYAAAEPAPRRRGLLRRRRRDAERGAEG